MISAWTTTALTPESWEPSRFLSTSEPRVRVPWPEPLVVLGDLCASVALPWSILDHPMCVTPGCVDASTGRIKEVRPIRKARAISAASGLIVGDVLVPEAGTGPCVLVRDQGLRELAFARFVVLRSQGTSPIVLWATLSSRSGAVVRGELNAGGVLNRLSARQLLSIQLPVMTLSPSREASLEALVPDPWLALVIPPSKPSNWGVTDLDPANWQRALSQPDFDDVGGVPLSSRVDLQRGTVSAREGQPVCGAGDLPIADPGWVRRGSPRQWTRSARLVANPGDVLLAAIGRPAARVCDEVVAVGRDVYRLRFRHDATIDEAQALAGFLNSDIACRLLAAVAGGTSMPRVDVRAIADLPVPELREYLLSPRTTSVALPDRLERALWSE